MSGSPTQPTSQGAASATSSPSASTAPISAATAAVPPATPATPTPSQTTLATAATTQTTTQSATQTSVAATSSGSTDPQIAKKPEEEKGKEPSQIMNFLEKFLKSKGGMLLLAVVGFAIAGPLGAGIAVGAPYILSDLMKNKDPKLMAGVGAVAVATAVFPPAGLALGAALGVGYAATKGRVISQPPQAQPTASIPAAPMPPKPSSPSPTQAHAIAAPAVTTAASQAQTASVAASKPSIYAAAIGSPAQPAPSVAASGSAASLPAAASASLTKPSPQSHTRGVTPAAKSMVDYMRSCGFGVRRPLTSNLGAKGSRAVGQIEM